MSIPSTYASAAEARKAGWFSRRHQTHDAHRTAQETYRMDRDEKAAREQDQREATAAWRSTAKARTA